VKLSASNTPTRRENKTDYKFKVAVAELKNMKILFCGK
jgi:hypothetical protein